MTRILPTSATPSTGFTLAHSARPHPRARPSERSHVVVLPTTTTTTTKCVYPRHPRIFAEPYTRIRARGEQRKKSGGGERERERWRDWEWSGKKERSGEKRSACTPHASSVKKLLGSSSRTRKGEGERGGIFYRIRNSTVRVQPIIWFIPGEP